MLFESGGDTREEETMKPFILKGTVVSAPTPHALEIVERGYLIAEGGYIVGVYPHLPSEYATCPVQDMGDSFILQSFSDMHLHGPQYPMLGMGGDMELLEWLSTYTFPTESAFSDPVYAREIYEKLATELVENGTTRVCMFSSLHGDATLTLMEVLERAGITGYVGKVNMDRQEGDYSETPEMSRIDTLKWLSHCDRFQHVHPILTPRFSPACTEDTMRFLGELAKERGLPIQSHLSENRDEVAWVKSLYPNCQSYYETYRAYGLWNHKTLMAHCVWSDEEELNAIREAGVTVVHCADSNMDLRSGVAPIRRMLDRGIPVTLGSDIAGGEHISVFDIVASTIKASKIKYVEDGTAPDSLTVSEAWYMATSNANRFFGEGAGFAPGNAVNVMVVSDAGVVSPRPLSPHERFERLMYRRRWDCIRRVWSGERLVFSREDD